MVMLGVGALGTQGVEVVLNIRFKELGSSSDFHGPGEQAASNEPIHATQGQVQALGDDSK